MIVVCRLIDGTGPCVVVFLAGTVQASLQERLETPRAHGNRGERPQADTLKVASKKAAEWRASAWEKTE